jgi:glycosyltransferase involved in cell wall biosynthesis
MSTCTRDHRPGKENTVCSWVGLLRAREWGWRCERGNSFRTSLKIIGDADPALRREVGQLVAAGPNVEFLGRRSRSAVISVMRDARVLIVPSEAYETFGLTIIEAFACGIPVIAANHGAPGELVEDRISGVHFRPGDAADLARTVRWAWALPEELKTMGRRARRLCEDRYSPDRNYELLDSIYRMAGKRRAGSAVRNPDSLFHRMGPQG